MVNKNKDETFIIYIHILIAFLCLIAYTYATDYYKIIFMPYIVFMFWKEDPKYFPALIVHSLSGSIISILILILCALKTIEHYKFLAKMTNRWVLILSLLPAPVIIYQIIIRTFYLNISFINNIIHAGLYLGIFSFFYGILIAKKLNKDIINAIINVLIFIMIFNAFGFISNMRGQIFSYVFFCVIGLLTIAGKKRYLSLNNIIIFSGIILIAMLLTGFIDIRFHFLFSIVLSFLMVYLHVKNSYLIDYLSNKIVIIFSIAVLAFIIYYTNEYASSSLEFRDYTFDQVSNYPQLLYFKIFGDRGILWQSVWNDIIYYKYFIPPLVVKPINYVTTSGIVIEYESGAHNIVLELIRVYGIIFGLIISTIYFIILIFLGKTLKNRIIDKKVLLLVSTAYSIMLIVGIVGVFVLTINFSFLIIGLSGLSFSYTKFNLK